LQLKFKDRAATGNILAEIIKNRLKKEVRILSSSLSLSSAKVCPTTKNDVSGFMKFKLPIFLHRKNM
jgi:hypothetical protein